MPPSRWLPPIRSAMPLWAGATTLALSVGMALGALAVLGGEDSEAILSYLLLALLLSAAGVWALIQGYRDYLVCLWAIRDIGRRHGLEFRRRVREDDLAPFATLMLFRYTAWCRRQASFLLRGTIEGQAVILFELLYSGHVVGGRQGAGQFFLVLIEPRTPLPEFFLTSAVDDLPDWVFDLRPDDVPLVLDRGPRRSVAVSADRDAVHRFFSPARQQTLGDLTDWMIESQGGKLLLYKDCLCPGRDVPLLFARALAIARSLTEPITTPLVSEPGNTDTRPDDMVTAGRRRSLVLPPTRPVWLLPTGLSLLAATLLFLPIVWIVHLSVGEEAVLMVAAYVAGYGATPALIFLFEWFRNRHRFSRAVRHAGKVLGLPYRTEVTWHDLEPFQHLPLFRFTAHCQLKGNFLLHGTVDGYSVVVFEFAYLGRFPGLAHRGGCGGRQLVVLIAPVVPLPDFSLAPSLCDWDNMDPTWPIRLGVGPTVVVFADDIRRSLSVVRFADSVRFDTIPPAVRGHDETAVRQLFTAERQFALGDLGGWTVECRAGTLAAYRHWLPSGPGEVLPLINKAIDIARVLTAPLDTPAAGSQTVTEIQDRPEPFRPEISTP